MNVSLLLFQLTNGIIWGLIVALLAVGLNLIYGLLNIVNIAQGALYMLGAYGVWLTVTYTGSFLLGLIVGPLVIGALAILLERTMISSIAHDHDLTIVLTFGLGLVLEQAVLALMGGEVRPVPLPFSVSVPLFGFHYPGVRIVVALIAVAAMAGLWLFLNRTNYGLWIRAVRYNPPVAAAMGVPVKQIFAVTFGIGAMLAALGGALASPMVSVRPEMGSQIIVIVFVVVIVGGLGNIFGSAVISVLLAASEGVASVFTNPTWARVISLLVMSLIILRWPSGLGAIALRRS
jgi:branched-chain amino acid transport system permease protein